MPFAMQMPPQPAALQRSTQEACVVGAAQHYHAHPDLIYALMRVVENGCGKIRLNKDGSYDMGCMQINSVHLKELSQYGITQSLLIADDCWNIYVGTWFMQKKILARGDFWLGVGDYHSKTPAKNREYQGLVYKALQTIWRSRGQLEASR